MSSLPDTQNQRDTRQIAIDRVGVRSLRYPVQIRQADGALQHTIAQLSLSVGLPHEHKGTHMSRFLEALRSHGTELDIRAMAKLPEELCQRLHAETAHVEVRFPFFITKSAPATGAKGLLDYEIVFDVDRQGSETVFTVTVEVPVATLCPCSKAISARGAHNQRSIVRLAVRFLQPVWIEELIRLVEASASCELYSVLKRPDEKAVTERAYDNPAFVEDVVRNVAVRCREHPQITWFRVESENFESIHNHNAFAVIEQTLAR